MLREGAQELRRAPILGLLVTVVLLATACLTINTLYALPGRSLAGLGLIALGLPVYFYYTRRRPQLQMDDEPEGDRTP